MDGLEIDGGKPLHGDIIISGAKNAALPLLCLGLITDAPLILENVPELVDTISMEGLLRHLGADVTREGEIVTIIGPNGAGKSTTAKLAVGTIRANEGRVQRQAGLRVGYVPQKLHIDPALPMRVDRLLDLTAKVSPDEKKQALEAVGASHLATAFVQDLSGGEFQRILLARAIVRRPNLLVLDEPVQGVDFASEAMLYNLIRQIRDATGCGVLMISHDLHIVMADTDTVLCLNGHICCSGSPDSVVSNPEYLRLFGAPDTAALAVYRHDHDHIHLPDGTVQHADGSISDSCHPDKHEHNHDRHNHDRHNHDGHDHV